MPEIIVAKRKVKEQENNTQRHWEFLFINARSYSSTIVG